MASIELSDRSDFRKYPIEYQRFRGDLCDRFISDTALSADSTRRVNYTEKRLSMDNTEKIEDCRIVCDVESYILFSVRFKIKSHYSKKILGEVVTNIVGASNTKEDEIYQAAEESARSWGAFEDPNYYPMALMHHLYNIEFEPVSIERVTAVHGIIKSDAKPLADTKLRQSFD